jgi:hypothetical protein
MNRSSVINIFREIGYAACSLFFALIFVVLLPTYALYDAFIGGWRWKVTLPLSIICALLGIFVNLKVAFLTLAITLFLIPVFVIAFFMYGVGHRPSRSD